MFHISSRSILRILHFLLTLVSCSSIAENVHAPHVLTAVAAENFYGELIKQIGAENINVVSILSNPEQDPHTFETSPAIARKLAQANLVVYNGIGYDSWLEKLLSTSATGQRKVISAAYLLGKKDGDNPHLWYLPSTMPILAKAICDYLQHQDPIHRCSYEKNLSVVLSQLACIEERVRQMRDSYAGEPITASEPIFGYMAEALGLEMRNSHFQLAMMNNTEPSVSDIVEFERDLRECRVRAIIYNSQSSNQMTRHLLSISKQMGIPSIAVTETQPVGKRFDIWMLDILDQLDQAIRNTNFYPCQNHS